MHEEGNREEQRLHLGVALIIVIVIVITVIVIMIIRTNKNITRKDVRESGAQREASNDRRRTGTWQLVVGPQPKAKLKLKSLHRAIQRRRITG